MSKPHVVDVTAQTFQTDVMEYSQQRPVLVDFWADWCGPCKTLGPILEQLAEEFRGAFRLAKVDTDAEKDLAMTFRIQSLPTVAIVWGGQILDQFSGAIPKADLKRMLQGMLEQLNIAIPEDDTPPEDPAQALGFWSRRLDKDPKDSEALLELGRLKLASGDSEGARTLLEQVEAAADQYSGAQAALNTLALAEEVATAGGEAAVRARLQQNPEDTDAAYFVACAEASAGHFAAALEVFVGLVARTRAEEKERAKKAASIVFEAAGRDDPDVETLRRKLARLLF